MPSREAYSAMKRARELRAALGEPADQPLRCLLELVERGAGVPVAVLELPDSVDGAYVRRPAGQIIFVNGRRPTVRARFTLAHELGHHHLGHGTAIDTPDSLRDHTTRIEADANAFAAELLLPREAVRRLPPGDGSRWRPSLDEIVHIACAFGVSAQMVRIRLQTWGAVTDRAVLEDLDTRITAGEHLERYGALGLDGAGIRDGVRDAQDAMPRFPPRPVATAV